MADTLHTDRPVEGPIYADEYIEFWGLVYLANPWLRTRGILFETFLLDPAIILYAAGAPASDCRRILLVAQRLVCERLDRDDLIERLPAIARGIAAAERSGARCENGRWVTKLRHHSHARADVHFVGGRP